jgi:hypothetical protein
MKKTMSIALIVALICMSWSCTKTVTVKSGSPNNPKLAEEKILGITTLRGEEIAFDEPGGKLVGKAIEANVKNERRTFILSDVQHVWLQKKKLTTGAKVGLVAGAGLVAVVVVAAASLSSSGSSSGKQSSCPFVYSWDGRQYSLDGEPYGGAIAQGLAREDWSELRHIRDVDGEYRVLMTNEADETQHTDLAELWVADHPAGSRVVADGEGRLIGLSNPQKLLAAQAKFGRDLTPWLIAQDHTIWEPEPFPYLDGSLKSEVILTFPKPEGAKNAWLISNLATGTWGSLMIKDMMSLLGRDANAWLQSLDRNFVRASSVYNWVNREETLRLKVDVEESNGWHTCGTLSGGGPIVAEDRALSMDMSGVQGDRVRIKIRPPNGFWALNSFEVSYDSAGSISFTKVAAQSARTSDDRDVLKELASVDKVFYSMPQIGDAAELRFKSPLRPSGMERTVFLHTQGWYQIHLRSDREPNQQAFNEVLTTSGGFSQFMVKQYEAWKHTYR